VKRILELLRAGLRGLGAMFGLEAAEVVATERPPRARRGQRYRAGRYELRIGRNVEVRTLTAIEAKALARDLASRRAADAETSLRFLG